MARRVFTYVSSFLPSFLSFFHSSFIKHFCFFFQFQPTTFGLNFVLIKDWNPIDFDNLTNLVVQPELIWLPSDVGIENSVDAIYQSSFRTEFRAIVDFEGKVTWTPGGRISTSCKLDVTYYPVNNNYFFNLITLFIYLFIIGNLLKMFSVRLSIVCDFIVELGLQ